MIYNGRYDEARNKHLKLKKNPCIGTHINMEMKLITFNIWTEKAVNLMPQPLLTWGKAPVPNEEKAGWVGLFREKSLALPRIECWIIWPTA
jgi:hypothetical protein